MEEITPMIDEMIHQSQYGQITLAIWVMWVAVVVVLIALGLDFWRNIFGMWFFPRMNYPRIAGEQQVIPGMFVALMFGLINGIISFNYYRVPSIMGSFLAQVDNMFKPMFEQLSEMAGVEFTTLIDNMMKDPDYVFGLLATVPILCGFGWFFAGLAYFVTGKVLSKSGGGLTNYLAGLPYFSWMIPFFFLGYWLGFINPTAAMVFHIIGAIFMLFYLIMTMRDFWHVSWGNTIVGVVIVGPILWVIFMCLFVIFMLYLFNQISGYI